jgi:hypothetical protein
VTQGMGLCDKGSTMTDTSAKRGRPTKYSAAKAALICDAISAGRSIRQAAADQNISWTSVYLWRDQRPEFATKLAMALAVRAELMSEELVAISDDSSADWVEYETATGRIRREPNHEHVQRSRLRVETRKWLIQKWNPQKYGDQQRFELTGPGGGPILLEQITMAAMVKLEAERPAAANPGAQVIDDAQDAPRLIISTRRSRHSGSGRPISMASCARSRPTARPRSA